MQAKLGYLPSAVAHNDFIFAVLAEELGLLGSMLVILAFGLVVFGCIKAGAKSSDRFGAMICSWGFRTINDALVRRCGSMTIGITPITGLPLPFLSYGGSLIVTCFLMLGVVQSVYRHRKRI